MLHVASTINSFHFGQLPVLMHLTNLIDSENIVDFSIVRANVGID